MSDFTTTFGDSTLILTNGQDIELGTAQLGDQFGTIKRAVIKRTGDREIIAHAKTKEILMVLIHNPGFEMMLECAFAKSVTAPGMGESLSLPLVGVTGFVMEGVTVQWEAGSERGLMIPVSAWDVMQSATAYRTTNAGEVVSLGTAGLSAPIAAPTLSGSTTTSSITTLWGTTARAVTYELQVSSDGTNWATLTSGTGRTHTHAVSASTTRFYRVRAVNGAGNGPWSDTLELATTGTAPATAPVLSGFAVTSSYDISLSWTTSIDATADFELQASTDGSTWTALTTTVSGTYTHAIGAPATTRRYRVRARNSAGNGPWSNVRILTSASIGAISLNVTIMPGALALNWTSDVLAANFQVQSSSDAGATWSDLIITGALSYNDDSMADGETRHYRARARNTADTGPWSNIVSATLSSLAAPVLTLSPASYTLYINATMNPVPGASGYEIEYDSANDFASPDMISSGAGSLTIYPTSVVGQLGVSAPAGNQLFYARARAKSGSLTGPWSAVVSAATPPDAPGAQAWSTWVAHWDASSGADRYALSLGGVLITTTAGTSFDFNDYQSELLSGAYVTVQAIRDSDGATSSSTNLFAPPP